MLVRLTFKYGSGSASLRHFGVPFSCWWVKVKNTTWRSHPPADTAPTRCPSSGLLWNSLVSWVVWEWVMTCLQQMSLMSHDRQHGSPAAVLNFTGQGLIWIVVPWMNELTIIAKNDGFDCMAITAAPYYLTPQKDHNSLQISAAFLCKYLWILPFLPCHRHTLYETKRVWRVSFMQVVIRPSA